jgi:quinol monooxygenase YgiN
MSRFGQHTKLVAVPGKGNELAKRFLDAADIQGDNPDCEPMLVSTAPESPDIVYLTEVWSSEERWEAARNSEEIQAWSASMGGLVDRPPDSVRLDVVGGKEV